MPAEEIPARRDDIHYDPRRYDGLDDRVIASELRGFVGSLLLRGLLQTILARREIGGLLTEYRKAPPARSPSLRGIRGSHRRPKL